MKIGKSGNGNLNFESGFTWRSPQLELNDIGFMRQADDLRQYTWITYKSIQPFSVFRSAALTYKHWVEWDFGWNPNRVEWNLDVSGVFLSNWEVSGGLLYKPLVYKISALQGGPRLKYPHQMGSWAAFGSDTRKKLSVDVNAFLLQGGNADNFTFYSLSTNLKYQPINALNMAIEISYSNLLNWVQFIQQVEYNNTERILTGFIDQQEFGTSIRLNYALNSNLSIQYYGQPYISIGEYKKLNYINDPVAPVFEDRFNIFQESRITDLDDVYEVDEESNGVVSYSFAKPDFSFVQFRSNAVMRWEYVPGSELFLVWSQGFQNTTNPANQLIEQFSEQLLQQTFENTFLLKWTYRFIK